MKKLRKIEKILAHDIWFHIYSFTSIGLIVTSFFIPPTGIIDSSVFAAVGEIFGFAALYEVHRAIDKGIDAKVSHNNTTIEINNDDKDELPNITDD